VLTSIAQNIEDTKNVFFNLREKAENTKDKVLLILVTSNRGLCGAYNAQIIKKSVSLVKDLDVDIITIGKKGDVAMRRLNQNILASFFELPDHINLRDVNPISDYILSEYQKGNYDKVLVAYTDFVSALTQRPNIKQVLPISKIELKDLIDNLPEDIPKTEKSNTPKNTDYLFEGDQEKFIGKLAEKITKMQIYQMLLESNASEQSSRMIAMKNASEASGEMIDDLTLMFNKARQSNITREISEISAGMASIN
jgi:F-type H+-transporting ATPase subunit gamma